MERQRLDDLEQLCARIDAAEAQHHPGLVFDLKREIDPWDELPELVAALREAWAERDRLQARLNDSELLAFVNTIPLIGQGGQDA